MTIVTIAQLTGTLAVFILFCLKFWIAINPNTTKKTLRIAILWTAIWVFFFFVILLLALLNIGTREQRILAINFTLPIPLIAVITQLYLQKRMDKELE